MSGQAAKTHAPDPPQKGAKPKRWKVVVNNSGVETSAAQANEQDHIPADRLREAARHPRPLPYRTELEAQFGADLSGIALSDGPEVTEALEAQGVEAAVLGDTVLARPGAERPVIAHEVAHILQQRAPGVAPPGPDAEVEALGAEAHVAANRPVPPVETGIGAGAVAYRRPDDEIEAEIVVPEPQEAAEEFEAGRDEPVREAEIGGATQPPQPETEAEEGATEAPVEGEEGALVEGADLGEDVAEDATPTFEPAPMPELEVDTEAAEAAQEEAEAALEGAEDADGLMTAFKDAPPSVKAMRHDTLEAKTGDLAAEDQTKFETDMPEFKAEMSGTDDLPETEAVQTPEAAAAEGEEGTVAPPPEPQVDPTPDPGRAELNEAGARLLDGWFTPGEAQGLGRAFSRVNTSDRDVDTSAGERPEVPLENATDPQRVTDQDREKREEAKTRRQEATQAVLDGPGPETVELQSMSEDYPLEPRAAPEIAEAEGPVEGAAEFRQKELDPEVVALFDQHHDEAMAQSMAGAEEEAAAAVDTRDTDRETKVTEAEAERDRLNAEADETQRDEVTTRRQEVQDARQTAVDDQARHVQDLEDEADTKRQEAEGEIDTEVTEAEGEVETKFAQAETDAEDEVQAGEDEAEEERRRQEREAENQSWWDRATDWVAEQFDKLTQFINDVFDKVRSAVKDIIDKVKDAAIELIDKAAAAITSAIEVFGEALKSAVNTLLAEHFPAVAQALNDAIDVAVDAATTAVNAVAEGLKAAVSALLNALAAAIDAILAAYQAAINAALAIARAALTGDWGELARLILDPILTALGIQPEAFYGMIEKAMQALGIIIDDPVGFLSNLVDAVVGGIRQFASNLLTHLQAGIIGWLTGALGGDIQIPERFDLRGVLELARQILGLTLDMLRRVAVRILGEEAVERIEFVMSYLVELVTGGFSALWDKIMADLGDLKDMVLDAIKSFLMERVIMAAISWLAGLFSPVGALVKLVMTIWNFLMFLKDQLSRIIEVVQKVVATMYEIATGVLAPAMQGVEDVLARLLPIAIDLLARLLGLGNVAGRVRRIIADVRQRIEDAIVNLIRRVLSAFTGGRSGGTGDEDTEAEDEGALMEPMSFGNEEEQHTLYLEERNGNVVPMMRSEPLPIETWLQDLTGDGARRVLAARRPALAEETIAERAPQIQDKARRALGIEEDLDAQGDQEDQQPQLARTGGQLTRVLNEIMALIGGRGVGLLSEIFEPNVAKMHPELRDQMRLILRGIDEDDAKQMRELTWAQMTNALWDHDATPGIWKRQAESGGIIRQQEKAGGQFREAVQTIVNGKDAGALPDEAVNDFFANFLTEQLNQSGPARAMFDVLLNSDDMHQAAAAVKSEILKAADAKKASVADGPDVEVKDKVKSSTIFSLMRQFLDKDLEEGRAEFRVWTNNDPESGSSSGPYTLLQMLTDSRVTERTGKNSEHVGNAIRGAGNVVRPHEWILASTASNVMQHAANATASGDPEAIKGASELIDFQEKVRTPTTELIFDPKWGGEVTVRYRAKPHRESDQYKNTPMARLPAEKRNTWYPPEHPKEGDVVGVLQAHSGGLYAYHYKGGFSDDLKTQAKGSGKWHTTLEETVNAAAAKLVSPSHEAKPLRDAIIGHYEKTIWTGETEPRAAAGKLFPNYYRSPSESAWTSYGKLKDEFSGQAEKALETLTQRINEVLKG